MTQIQDRTDTNLKTAILAELAWTAGVNSTHIGVAVDQGAVSLSGEVETYPERRLAERAAMRVHGVTAIAEDITVRAATGARWTTPTSPGRQAMRSTARSMSPGRSRQLSAIIE